MKSQIPNPKFQIPILKQLGFRGWDLGLGIWVWDFHYAGTRIAL